jgi:hypothetical protein
VAESEYQNLLSRRLRLGGRLGHLRELCSRVHLRVVSIESSCACHLHAHNPQTAAIYTRPQHSGARNPQTPAVFTRPQPSDTRHPHTLHVLEADDSPYRFFVQRVAILIGSGGGEGEEIVYGLLPSRRPLYGLHALLPLPLSRTLCSVLLFGADGADLHEPSHSCTFPHHWWWERVHVPITALSTSVPSSSYLSCGHLNVKLIRLCR